MSLDAQDLLGELSGPYRDDFMRTCYVNMVNNPEMLKSQHFDKVVQGNAIDIVIKYFEDLEEYEKCYDLKKIKEKVLKNGGKN
jgi:hypothetical protein